MNKRVITILILLSLFTCIYSFTPTKVTADSGFDTSYDSGGWSSTDSDWSSSSSYSSDGEPLTPEGTLIFFIVIIIIVIIAIVQNQKANSPNSLTINPHNIDENIIKKYIPEFNKEQFLNDRYNDYLKVQDDWMNFNYDGLREILTDELYNQYTMQLDTLKIKNQKNIMKNFYLRNSDITNIREENGTLIVDVEMIISFIDYIEKDGKAVRGSKNSLVHQHYSMTFVMVPTPIDKCPNCGAKLEDKASQVCPYCRSNIARVGNKWVLSKKESLRQK